MATAGYRRQAGAPALYIRQVLRLYIGPAVVKCVQICCSPSQAPSGYIQLGAGCPATQCERSRGSLSGRRHAVADSVRLWPGALPAVTNGHIRQFWVPLGAAVTFGDRAGSAAPVLINGSGKFGCLPGPCRGIAGKSRALAWPAVGMSVA